MGGWKNPPLRNFAWQGVWGAALEFSSCFCMGRCSKILLRFGWYPLPSPLGSFCVPPPFWLVGVHGGRQFLQQSPPFWPWSWPTPSTNRSEKQILRIACRSGQNVRTLCTSRFHPICRPYLPSGDFLLWVAYFGYYWEFPYLSLLGRLPIGAHGQCPP